MGYLIYYARPNTYNSEFFFFFFAFGFQLRWEKDAPLEAGHLL